MCVCVSKECKIERIENRDDDDDDEEEKIRLNALRINLFLMRLSQVIIYAV